MVNNRISVVTPIAAELPNFLRKYNIWVEGSTGEGANYVGTDFGYGSHGFLLDIISTS